MTREANWAAIEKRARAEQQSGETIERAVARFIQTDDGRQLYDAYRRATPEVIKSAPPEPHLTLADLAMVAIEDLAGELAGRPIGWMGERDRAVAIAKALDHPEGRDLYAVYRSPEAGRTSAASIEKAFPATFAALRRRAKELAGH